MTGGEIAAWILESEGKHSWVEKGSGSVRVNLSSRNPEHNLFIGVSLLNECIQVPRCSEILMFLQQADTILETDNFVKDGSLLVKLKSKYRGEATMLYTLIHSTKHSGY
jgi:hypothetical protein